MNLTGDYVWHVNKRVAKAVRLLWVRRDRQKVKEESEKLRGEPPFAGASSFAGLDVPFLLGMLPTFMVLSHGINKAANGYDQLHAIHTRVKQQGTGGAASRYEIKQPLLIRS